MTAMFDQAAHTRGRHDVHQVVSPRLAALDDQDLEALIRRAVPLGSGIGGASALLELDGVQVFVKKVPLTDIERSGVNRVRREVRDRFNEMLYPDGEERILDVLFDEYVVQ